MLSLLNFRYDYQSFAMKKGYDFFKFREKCKMGTNLEINITS